ncbi:hypothetical protein IFM89_036975, partial [Coptis chinensis]
KIFPKKKSEFLNNPPKTSFPTNKRQSFDDDDDVSGVEEDDIEGDIDRRYEDEKRLNQDVNWVNYGTLPEYKLRADLTNFSGSTRLPEDKQAKMVAYKLKGVAQLIGLV